MIFLIRTHRPETTILVKRTEYNRVVQCMSMDTYNMNQIHTHMYVNGYIYIF